ncbi:hypothetical protein FRC04_010846 [Tulasnella sp. 424]|nr:hypothetical protein FRC04_010846 [Tulasnella sp. 424]
MAGPGFSKFKGKSGKECDSFIRYIRRTAFEEGKHKDYEWMAGFASSLYSGRALRWHSKLEDEVRENWKRLEQEMIEEFGVSDDSGDSEKDEAPVGHKLRIGIEGMDGRSNHSYQSDFDAATTTARSPTPSSASTPVTGPKKVIRDPTGYTGVIQIALISLPSGLSEAAKARWDPASIWYIRNKGTEVEGQLTLTSRREDALRVTFENQHVLKITNTETKYQWLGVRWVHSGAPHVSLDSTDYAVLVRVDGVDSKTQTCIGSNLAGGQISHTNWALAGRTHEIMSKWERPVQDRRRLGHMADLPAVLNLDNHRLAFLAGRPGDFFHAMSGDGYASVRLVFHPDQ